MHICDGLWVAHVSRNKTSAEADVLFANPSQNCENTVGSENAILILNLFVFILSEKASSL